MSSSDLDPASSDPEAALGHLSARVAADMRELFARAGAEPDPTPLRPLAGSGAVSALRPRSAGARPLAILAATAAGLAGLAAGALVIRPLPAQEPARAAAVSVARPAPVAVPRPAPTSATALASAEPARPPVVSTARPSVAEPGPAEPVAAPKPEPARPVRRAAAPRSERIQSRPKPTRVKAAQTSPAPQRERAADCTRDVYGAGCRTAVAQADRRLRAAYARAVRQGVPRAVLIDYRDRWADLRERETDRPRVLVEEYGVLARELGRVAVEEREHPRPSSPLHQLKEVIAPWW